MSKPELSLHNARQLSLILLALLGRDGGEALMVAEDDSLYRGRLARIGGLALVEFAGTPRHIDLYLAEGEKAFRLDAQSRLCSLCDCTLHLERDPDLWFNAVMITLMEALGPDSFALH